MRDTAIAHVFHHAFHLFTGSVNCFDQNVSVGIKFVLQVLIGPDRTRLADGAEEQILWYPLHVIVEDERMHVLTDTVSEWNPSGGFGHHIAVKAARYLIQGFRTFGETCQLIEEGNSSQQQLISGSLTV
jgi:hypothetical protein